MAEDLDRKVAEALGWEIVPWATEAERPCIWEGDDGTLFVRRFKVACESGCDCCTEPFRPSTDAGDAIAALERFCWVKSATPTWSYYAAIGKHVGEIKVGITCIEVFAESFCEWCCNAILLASEAAT